MVVPILNVSIKYLVECVELYFASLSHLNVLTLPRLQCKCVQGSSVQNTGTRSSGFQSARQLPATN